MIKILLLLLLVSCSSYTLDKQALAYNKCATTCNQQGFSVAQSSLDSCTCGARTEFRNFQLMP